MLNLLGINISHFIYCDFRKRCRINNKKTKEKLFDTYFKKGKIKVFIPK